MTRLLSTNQYLVIILDLNAQVKPCFLIILIQEEKRKAKPKGFVGGIIDAADKSGNTILGGMVLEKVLRISRSRCRVQGFRN